MCIEKHVNINELIDIWFKHKILYIQYTCIVKIINKMMQTEHAYGKKNTYAFTHILSNFSDQINSD